MNLVRYIRQVHFIKFFLNSHEKSFLSLLLLARLHLKKTSSPSYLSPLSLFLYLSASTWNKNQTCLRLPQSLTSSVLRRSRPTTVLSLSSRNFLTAVVVSEVRPLYFFSFFLFSSLTFFLCGPKRSLSGNIFHAEIQGAISKMDPEIIKSLLATGANPSDTSTRSLSVPSTPKEDHQRILISPVLAPLTRLFSCFLC